MGTNMSARLTLLICAFATALLVASACGGDGSALGEDWGEGFEEEYVDHTFEEEMWTNDDIGYTNDDGSNGSFTASYVNANNVQAFLVAFNGRARWKAPLVEGSG